jgi:hypothetical protein
VKLLLERTTFKEHFTLGTLSVDGKHLCYTCEDTQRAAGVKVYGETAIPCGTYVVVYHMSSHFKKLMPMLVDVPGFTYIYMHSGNGPEDTLGCILVGNTISVNSARPLQNSRDAFGTLMLLLDKAHDENETITITIKDNAS